MSQYFKPLILDYILFCSLYVIFKPLLKQKCENSPDSSSSLCSTISSSLHPMPSSPHWRKVSVSHSTVSVSEMMKLAFNWSESMDSFPYLSGTLCGIWFQMHPYWDLLFLRVSCSFLTLLLPQKFSLPASFAGASNSACLYMLGFRGHTFSYWSKYKPTVGIRSA